MHSGTALAQAMEPVRPSLELADIFRSHGEDYQKEHRLNTQQFKAMTDIQLCRTAAMGGHVDVCDHGCGYMRISYNSCRNRNCPKCQGLQSARWLEKRFGRILPTQYFHMVVTFPHQLNPLILNNKEVLYNILFRAAAQSLLELARDWKRLQAQIGFTAILHTWNQDMRFHPHLHLVVTAGGLDRSQTKWIESQNNFLVPVKALSVKIRGKFVHHLK
ncbi:MAG: transposase zinc-binding domain-containing protein, partial [Desulfomonile sp.]